MRAVVASPIDSFGHHYASCTRTGALGRRGFALESVAARVCGEAGGRVTKNVMVRDLDLPVLNATDSRQLEVVVDGLPLFAGSQLALDAMWCVPFTGTVHLTMGLGVTFPLARRCKERRYPELVGPWLWTVGGRAHSSLSWRRQKLDENRVSLQKRAEQALEDEVESHPLLRSCEGSRKCLLGLRCAHGSATATPGWLRKSVFREAAW